MNDFHGLYERYAKPLYRFAVALSGNPAEAEDLVADAFVRLWTAPGEIREATVKAYLFTIVRNLFLTRRRGATRQVPLEESVPADAPAVDQRTAAAAELARVKEVLRTLPALDRAALLMRGQQGRSYEDIGAALGVSAGAARVRVHRVRLQLAKAIGEKSMTITRDVIIDLLPVYAAGEASADTRALVEQYLKNDASLSALLHTLQAADRTNEAEHDPSPAVEREAINRTRAMIRRRGWTLGLAIFFTLVPFTFAWSGDRVTFFMLRDEPGSALFFVSALYLWWQCVRLGRKLRSAIP